MSSKYQVEFSEILRSCLEIIAPFKAVLPSWYERINALLVDGASARLRIGVVGVTSSGKSTFINGFFGEQILPEQSKATTNLPVLCRYGHRRQLRIIYKDKPAREFLDSDVTPTLVRNFCTEDENPGNEKRVSRIELELPSCCLASDLEVIDTPGTDAFGLDEHGAITIQTCIPISDIVVFMTHARQAGLHKADARLLENVIEGDQRVMFVISSSDVILANTEGGIVTKSRETKLANIVQALKASLLDFPKLRQSAVITVSSLWAREAHGDRRSDHWRASNFQAVLDTFNEYVADLEEVLSSERLRRTRGYISSLASALPLQASSLQDRAVTTSEEKILELNIQKLRRARSALKHEVRQMETSAATHVNQETIIAHAIALIATAARSDVAGVYRARDLAEQDWHRTTQAQLAIVANVRQGCRDILEKVAVSPSRKALQERVLQFDPFPAVSDYVSTDHQTYEVAKPRSGFLAGIRDWLFGVETETHTRTTKYVDAVAFRRALKEYYAAACKTFQAFIADQATSFRDVYLGAIEEQLKDDERCLKDLRAIRTLAADQHERLPEIVRQLRQLIEEKCNPPPLRVETPIDARTYRTRAIATWSQKPTHDCRQPANVAIRTLLDRVWESMAINRFWEVAARTAGASKKIETLLWVGDKLARFRSFVDYLRRLPKSSDKCTEEESITVNLEVHRVGTVQIHGSLSDVPSSLENFVTRCSHASVIVVDFNAMQPSSGIKTLLEDKRYPAMRSNNKKLMLMSLDGAAFDSRLGDLPNEVATMVEKLAGFGSRPWYICETDRHDARYTDYLAIYDQVAEAGGSARDLVRRWREARLSMRAPFTQDALESSFVANIGEDH